MQQQPNKVQYHLEAGVFNWETAAGKTITAWGFNHQLPGPQISAQKGDLVSVIVTNKLPEPTVIHWHGIRLDAGMDGTDSVQQPIQPGQTFEYRFVVPDAGTFWYHAHHNETEQMEKGMYGSLVVSDAADPVVDKEQVFVIDDMKLDGDLQFKKGGFFARWAERHDGREGETLLINGKENTIIDIAAGTTERWRFINAASARYFRLYLGGKKFMILATDGGLIEKPQEVTEVMLAPGERVDIAAGPFGAGEEFVLESLPYNRMTMVKTKRRPYATVRVGAAKPSDALIPKRLRTIIPLAAENAAVTRKVKLSVGPSWKRGIDFLVNNELHHHDKPVRVDELQVWEVSNTSRMDHPFHLHGFFFQVLQVNGIAPQYIAWKDTVNLPPRSKVKIAWIPDNRPGSWMYHCHILEHHAAGMMGHFEVIDGSKPYVHQPVVHHGQH